MKLSKQQYKECFEELKSLWNKFDPIGVFDIDSDWPDDEYEGYVPKTLSLLVAKSPMEELMEFIFETSNENMGITTPKEECEKFARECQNWFESKTKELNLE